MSFGYTYNGSSSTDEGHVVGQQAIGSACNANEGNRCIGQDVQNDYNQWADWYNKNQANFCPGQGPTFPQRLEIRLCVQWHDSAINLM